MGDGEEGGSLIESHLRMHELKMEISITEPDFKQFPLPGCFKSSMFRYLCQAPCAIFFMKSSITRTCNIIQTPLPGYG